MGATTEAMLWCLAASIVVCNTFVCLAFVLNKRLRSAANQFVLSMSIIDWIVGAVVIPCFILGPFRIHGPVFAFALSCEIANVAGCAYDRYVAILHPLLYQSKLTGRRVRRILAAIWLVPLVIALIPQIVDPQNGTNAMSVGAYVVFMRCYLGVLILAVLLTCCGCFAAYCRILVVARKHIKAINYLKQFSQSRRRSSAQRFTSFASVMRDVRCARLFAVISLTWLLCWLPFIYINLFYDVFPVGQLQSDDLIEVGKITIFANSLIDPLIYALFQSSYRKTIASWAPWNRCRSEQQIEQRSGPTPSTLDLPTGSLIANLSKDDEDEKLYGGDRLDDMCDQISGKLPKFINSTL